MTQFDYVAVFISIVMGLSVTHILHGFGATIQERHEGRTWWVHAVWAVNILHYQLSVWWAFFVWNQLDEWSYGLFLFLIGYTVVLYLLAAVIYPRDLAPGFDLRAHFLENRVWFFGLLLLTAPLDVVETSLKAEAGLRPMPDGYFVYVGILTSVVLVCLVRRDPRVLAVGGTIWLAIDLYYNATALGALGGLF